MAFIAAHHHLADHAGQAHALAVFRTVDARDAIGLQLADLRGHDDTTTAAKHLDVRTATGLEQVDHVLEVFDVPALVGTDGDALHILLQCRRDHFVDAAVVAQMDHLGAHALQDAAHDVDGRVMSVKQAGGGDEAHLVRRTVGSQGFVFSGQVGHDGFSFVGKRRASGSVAKVSAARLVN